MARSRVRARCEDVGASRGTSPRRDLTPCVPRGLPGPSPEWERGDCVMNFSRLNPSPLRERGHPGREERMGRGHAVATSERRESPSHRVTHSPPPSAPPPARGSPPPVAPPAACAGDGSPAAPPRAATPACRASPPRAWRTRAHTRSLVGPPSSIAVITVHARAVGVIPRSRSSRRERSSRVHFVRLNNTRCRREMVDKNTCVGVATSPSIALISFTMARTRSSAAAGSASSWRVICQ